MKLATVYVLFVVTVCYCLLVMTWVSMRLQPQHEQTWAANEPRLRYFHRNRVYAFLCIVELALLGFLLLVTQLTREQIQAQTKWLGLLIIMPAFALCGLIEVYGYFTTHLLLFKNGTEFYRDWDYYARDDSAITQIIMVVYSLLVVTVLVMAWGRAWSMWQ